MPVATQSTRRRLGIFSEMLIKVIQITFPLYESHLVIAPNSSPIFDFSFIVKNT